MLAHNSARCWLIKLKITKFYLAINNSGFTSVSFITKQINSVSADVKGLGSNEAIRSAKLIVA
ncbi:MAG: hypothetical protein Tsb005_20600 [Gammaproteobacteria bacterium]